MKTCILIILGSTVAKSLPANARDSSSIPGLEDPLEKEMATQSSILTWKIPWTRILADYSSWVVKRRTWLNMYVCVCIYIYIYICICKKSYKFLIFDYFVFVSWRLEVNPFIGKMWIWSYIWKTLQDWKTFLISY